MSSWPGQTCDVDGVLLHDQRRNLERSYSTKWKKKNSGRSTEELSVAVRCHWGENGIVLNAPAVMARAWWVDVGVASRHQIFIIRRELLGGDCSILLARRVGMAT